MEKYYLLLSASFIIAIPSCDRTTYGDPEVYGVYYGEYFGGKEKIELLDTGRFSQTFYMDNNVAYSLDGEWRLLDDGQTVVFEPFIHASSKPYSKISQTQGAIVHFGDGIAFDPDNNYIVSKNK